MRHPDPSIRVNVDPTNPGQFFACCGLLELADRLWAGAEGWYTEGATTFCLCPVADTTSTHAEGLIQALVRCKLTNTMTDEQVRRRYELARKKKKDLSAQE